MQQTLLIDGLKNRRLPINLRQSGNSDARMLISTRIRKSPWWHLSKAAGCWAYTTYNHQYHPRAYIKPEDGGMLAEYKFLTEHVSMWDVAVERQIQVKGPDAAAFVDYLITRDVHTLMPNMRARYVILCNQYGGIINDPVLLRVADDEFWFSISDSDVLLWAQGVNATGRFNVDIHELDVSPVQIQGPKSAPLMEKMFGSHIREIPYYGLIHETLNGHPSNHLAHRLLRRGRLRDLPAQRHAPRRRRLAPHPRAGPGVQPRRHRAQPHPPHRGRHPLLRPGHGHREQSL